MECPVIGIIGGNGKMGQMFASFFRGNGIKVLISDQGTKLTNQQLTKLADIVIVSVPIDITEKVITEILPYVRENSLLTDFTSIKESPVKKMLKGKCEVLGMHPMFGVGSSLNGQTIIFCPTKKTGKHSLWLENFFKKNKINIVKMSAGQHDKMMNIAQGLIHFSEIAFVDALRRNKIKAEDIIKLTGKASELKIALAARIIYQDAELYGNIQLKNPYAMDSLKEYAKSFDELYKIIEKKDSKKFKEYFERNKKFLGDYAKEAFSDTSYLIDKFLERKSFKNSVAILGPNKTFSSIAADLYIKQNKISLQKYFAKDIDEIFSLVEEGKVLMGIVPVENKIGGIIRESLNNLCDRKVHIEDQINLKIHHSLLTLKDSKIHDIKYILSHSQALSQCKKYLKKNFPNAILKPCPSTAFAVSQMTAENSKSTAVISSGILAEENGLKIIDKNIEDDKNNETSFAIIKRGFNP